MVEQLTLNQWVRGSSPRRCTTVGVFIAQGPPVPIPNTEVKLCGAEDTCLATDRENRSMPTQALSVKKEEKKLVLLSHRVHLYPFRTQKLSCAEPKILVWRRTGKIGQCQHFFRLKLVKKRRKRIKSLFSFYIYTEEIPPLSLNFIYNYFAFLRIIYTVA